METTDITIITILIMKNIIVTTKEIERKEK